MVITQKTVAKREKTGYGYTFTKFEVVTKIAARIDLMLTLFWFFVTREKCVGIDPYANTFYFCGYTLLIVAIDLWLHSYLFSNTNKSIAIDLCQHLFSTTVTQL